jgi:hypothetical protein
MALGSSLCGVGDTALRAPGGQCGEESDLASIRTAFYRETGSGGDQDGRRAGRTAAESWGSSQRDLPCLGSYILQMSPEDVLLVSGLPQASQDS